MRHYIFLLILLQVCLLSSAQVSYTITYRDSSSKTIKVSIQPATQIKAPVSFVMPRSVPGAYGISIYDQFVRNIYAITSDGKKHLMNKDRRDAPRWYYNDTGKLVYRIEYEMDLDRMERKIAPGDASILRPGFAGLLNYSILGWIDGKAEEAVQCSVETFSNWPIFSTNDPSLSLSKGYLTFSTTDFYALADGQLFLGDRFHVKEFKGIVPLFVASYCETADEYLDDYGKQELIAMGILKDYFGELPFQHYSIMLRSAIPLEPGNFPALAMEHLQSSSFFGDTSEVRRAAMSPQDLMKTIPTYLHHMAHAFIPLRCYGDTYQPRVMEIPPIINNIWFNEGFMWYIVYDTLKQESWKTIFNTSVYNTSPLIKKMSLQQLSQTASTMYAVDFRIGRSIYSRGALMAMEINEYLKSKTGGRKSMKDIYRYLWQWANENKRAFTMEEFPKLISQACNIDLTAIYQKWQGPIQ
jgi:predicted metalloprotease with PDZ domain